MRDPGKKLPPIAMLHFVSDSINDSLEKWCITRNKFLQLLDYLERNNYQTTHFEEIIENDNSRLFQKNIVLTFDDCPKELLDFAVPELVKRKMKAVFYIPTAYIGSYNSWDVEKGASRHELMDANDLVELANLGMEIGSHSHHHIELKNVTFSQTVKQVTISKTLLESIIQKTVYSFAYPYGSVPSNFKTILPAAGYQYAVSIYQPFETNLTLRRFGIYNKDTPKSLAFKLSTGYKWLRKLYDPIKKY